jgi:hypothetical protein
MDLGRREGKKGGRKRKDGNFSNGETSQGGTKEEIIMPGYHLPVSRGAISATGVEMSLPMTGDGAAANSRTNFRYP